MGKKRRNFKETSDIGTETTSAGEISKTVRGKVKYFGSVLGGIVQNTVGIGLMVKSLSGIAKEHDHLDIGIRAKKSIDVTRGVFANLVDDGDTASALPKGLLKGLGIKAGSGANVIGALEMKSISPFLT